MNKLLLYYLRKFPVDYGKSALIKYTKLPQGEEWVKYRNSMNLIFNLNLSEYQMKQIYLLDIYEKNTILQLKKLLPKIIQEQEVNVIDVGANIGFYSLSLGEILKDKKCNIHCFEPNPYTFKLLQQNVKENNISNIVLNDFGLSSEEASFELTYNERNLGTANIYSKSKNINSKTATIQCTKFDSYCKEKGINSVDVIKVDIEGAELDFFKGAVDVISKSPSCVIIAEIVDENCEKAGYSAKDLYDFIIQLGFETFLPKAFPFSLKKVTSMPVNYHDNIIFVKKSINE